MASEKAVLRRYEDNLYVCGLGVIILGVWDVVRPVMQILLGNMLSDLETGDPELTKIAMIIFWFLFAVFFFLTLGLHIFVGLNAVRAAKGKKYRKGYYAAAIIMLALTVLSFATYKDAFGDIDKIDTTVASMLVDITSVYIFVTLIRSTFKIRAHEKEKG